MLALYQTRLGELEYHLLNLQVECRALRRRIEQAVALLNRGAMLTQQILSDIEAQVKRDLLVWQTQISDQAQALAAGKAFFSELVFIDSTTQQRAKKAYRRLVRLLHRTRGGVCNPALNVYYLPLYKKFALGMFSSGRVKT